MNDGMYYISNAQINCEFVAGDNLEEALTIPATPGFGSSKPNPLGVKAL